MFMFMSAFMMTGQTFQGERPVFLREYANKMYSVLPYYLAKILADMPVFMIVPLVYIAICYFAIGFEADAAQFFKFVLNLQFTALCAISYGYLVSSIFKDAATALALQGVLAMPLLLVGGFFTNQGDQADYLTYFAFISPVQYSFNNMAILEFTAMDTPASTLFLAFLGVERSYWEGLLYMGILALCIQISSLFFLRILVEKFQ